MALKKEYLKLPYRPNISLVVFKRTSSGNQFLLVQLKDWQNNWWKFPQGGIDAGESFQVAGKREFEEELGNRNLKIIGLSQYTNEYDWPGVVIKKNGEKYRGQFQHFLLVEFLGKDAEIKLDSQEVRKFRWVRLEELLEMSQKEKPLFNNYHGVIAKIIKEFSVSLIKAR